MPVSTMTTKRHDTKIIFTDIPAIDGVPVPPANLAGCTVSFLLRDDTQTPPIAIKQPAIINVDGTFSYAPIPTDVATTGKFQQEWEVIYPDNKILTFPNNGYNIVKIILDLG